MKRPGSDALSHLFCLVWFIPGILYLGWFLPDIWYLVWFLSDILYFVFCIWFGLYLILVSFSVTNAARSGLV